MLDFAGSLLNPVIFIVSDKILAHYTDLTSACIMYEIF